MSDRSSASTWRLQTAILRSVSRSVYLSIRFVPAQLREPVALAYLLARTTDTVADTPRISGTLRAETLQTLSKAIQGKASRSVVVDLVASFAPLQQHTAERTLVESLPDCLEWLDHLDISDRVDVRALLEKITQGQMLDLKCFGDTAEITALPTAADLDEYTFLVAGCVGEFWTRLGFRHIRKFARLPEDEMLALGKGYGMGLQLVNILRDAGSDLEAGRCYFPEDELTSARLTPSQILSEPERFQPIYRNWVDKAECDSEPPCRRGNGFTGIDRGTHACAFARVRRNRVTSQDQGLAPRSARNNCPARDNIRSGLKVCCDVRTLFEVGCRRTASLPATKNNCVAFP